MNERSKALLMMSMLVCFWGLDYVFAKEALNILQPMNLLFLKYSVGFIVLSAITLTLARTTIVRLKAIPWFLLCAFFGALLSFFCEYNTVTASMKQFYLKFFFQLLKLSG